MHILYSVQSRTHPGQVRANNQDAYGVILDWRKKLDLTDADLQERGHLFAVADGMGGHAAGEVASQLAIETLFREYYTSTWQSPKANLEAAIAQANRIILEEAEAHPDMAGMGTTLVAAVYRPDDGWLIANVGDSRAYLFRDGRITQLTQDHSWVAEQARSGILTEEQAAHHPLRNVITRSLGGDAQVQPDFFERTARPRDIMLLCSDGLSNLVTAKEMAGLLKSYPLDEAAEKLLALALERGAPDNVTFVLVQLVGDKQRRSRSILPWLALISAVLILSGFLFWTYARPQPAATPTFPVVSLATNTPIRQPTPSEPSATTAISSPPATPLPTQRATAPVPQPISPLKVPTLEPAVVAAPVVVAPVPITTTISARFIFVQGPTAIKRNGITRVIITHRDRDTKKPFDYVAEFPQNAFPQILGAELGALVLSVEPTTGAFRSDNAWFLAPMGNLGGMFAVWWPPEAAPLVENQTQVILYTVNGQGGGDSLGIDALPGEEGAPIAVLGWWQRSLDGDFLLFQKKQVFDFDKDEQGYLPRP